MGNRKVLKGTLGCKSGLQAMQMPFSFLKFLLQGFHLGEDAEVMQSGRLADAGINIRNRLLSFVSFLWVSLM